MEDCKKCTSLLDSENIKTGSDYRKWSLKFHPDKFLDIPESEKELKKNKFNDITKCYDTVYKQECNLNSGTLSNSLKMPSKPVPSSAGLTIGTTALMPYMQKSPMKMPTNSYRSSPYSLNFNRSCGDNKIYRSGYTTKYGTHVDSMCVKKSRKRRSKSCSRRRRKSCSKNKIRRKGYTRQSGKRVKSTCVKKSRKRRSKSCSKNKIRRRSYIRQSGKRVKSTCVKKPLKCSPRKTRRRSYNTKRGTHVKSTCVRRRR